MMHLMLFNFEFLNMDNDLLGYNCGIILILSHSFPGPGAWFM